MTMLNSPVEIMGRIQRLSPAMRVYKRARAHARVRVRLFEYVHLCLQMYVNRLNDKSRLVDRAADGLIGDRYPPV